MREESDQETAASASSEEVERRAIDAALNFLAYRQRTGEEVRRKLVSRGFDEGTVETAMRRLSAVGLIDDEAFVGAFVRDRIAHRPMGVRRMVQELYLKGIAREVSAPAIEEVLREEEVDERELARRVMEKKRRTLGLQLGDLAVQRRRLRDHLIRRGFGSQAVRDVVDELLPRDGARDNS